MKKRIFKKIRELGFSEGCMENGSWVSSLNGKEKKWRGVGKIWGKGNERFPRDSTWERQKGYFRKRVEMFSEDNIRRRER